MRVQLKLKWMKPIALISVTIVLSLISLLFVVPLVFGSQLFSVSVRLLYIIEPAPQPSMKVVYYNGSVISIAWIGLRVNLTNHYLVPVTVKYNGFNYVWLIYNRTVTEPTDVVGNIDFLVWGAYYGHNGGCMGLFDNDGYEYYVTNKGRSDFVAEIGTTSDLWLFYSLISDKTWHGEDSRGNPVEPGIYYNYCIAFGKVGEPVILNVTSVLWSR